MNTSSRPIHIVGAGLAGSECAFQLAERGHSVVLYEMRNKVMTPAHKTDRFAELVCSNSFGSLTEYSAPGQLKWEAEQAGSLILKAAHEARVPAGMALGVDRDLFSNAVTETLRAHPNIMIENQLVSSLAELPRPAVIATGPLTHPPLAESLRRHFGGEFLYFFDAIAPIIDVESINFDIAWKGDRFGRGTGDYINCPLDQQQYYDFINAILAAKKVESKEFEDTPYFDGCMPIEEMANRGLETPRFGPMSPKGLRAPKTNEQHYAVVQLRQDNKAGTAYNMVGFQTKMAWSDQKQVFRMIPGLEDADFLKLGSIHRNLYIHSPKQLTPALSSRHDQQLYFAGQITGVEGYFESTCIGLMVARFIDDQLQGRNANFPPKESAFGSLLRAITEEKEYFQPTNINFGLLPPAEGKQFRGRRGKELRREHQLEVAKQAFQQWITK